MLFVRLVISTYPILALECKNLHVRKMEQAKSLGDYLIVGVHSDADILKNKGPPVMKEEER